MRRDARQARFLTLDSLRWVIRNRAWTPWYLIRFWRFFVFKVRNPHIITEGFVFLGRRVEVHSRRGYGRMIIGRWVHIGDENRIRCHEGTLRIGDKCVFGRDNTINCYLDVEIGDATIVADWVYICDFDHVYEDIHVPIKDQGLVKSPVRIGPDCWIGAKATVLRSSVIGEGSIIAAHAVVRGDVPSRSIVGGVPGRVLKNRADVYEAGATKREALADIERKQAAGLASVLAGSATGATAATGASAAVSAAADPDDAVEVVLTVSADPDKAFTVFVRDIDQWWPLQRHSVPSGATVVSAEIGEGVGGLVEQIDADGLRMAWGTVMDWKPGSSVAMTWHPGRDAEESTLVEVAFEPAAEGSVIRLRHSGFAVRGQAAAEAAEGYRKGWPVVLGRFARLIETGLDEPDATPSG